LTSDLTSNFPYFDVKTRIFRAVAKNKKTAKLLLFSGFFVVRYDGTPFGRKIKITAHAVIFVVRPQGLEPWTH